MSRTNKMINVLEDGGIVIFTDAEELDYRSGFEMSKTWADAILVDFEHDPFDTVGLKNLIAVSILSLLTITVPASPNDDFGLDFSLNSL